MKIVELDDKRHIGAEKAEFDFCTRHISVAGISNDTSNEYTNFLFLCRG